MRSHTGRWADLFLMFAVFLGAVVRFTPTVLARSPINDGGMFVTMIGDIRANHFLLPAFTSYNSLHIPFAYPPLSLYLGALASAVGMLTAADTVRWLPPLVSTLSILAFFWMATQMLGSRSTAALAAAAYALMPRSFSWYVMGGGLSRSLGVLFLLLTCGSAWILFTRPSRSRIIWTAAFGAGAVLSHPETALHTLAACALIWLFRGRSWRGARDAALVGLGVLVLTSPWWATVIMQHGLAPFESAMHTGAGAGFFLIPWLTLSFSQEPFATVLAALGLIGFVVQCIRREWFLPAWTILPFVVEPRSAPAIAALALCLLAGIGLGEFLLPKLASLRDNLLPAAADWTEYMTCSATARAIVAGVLLYAFLGAAAYSFSLAGVIVPAGSRSAMEWVKQNTAPDARFVVLTGTQDPFSDATAEWFPTLTDRQSVNTLQGREWTLGTGFAPFLNDLGTLEACLLLSPGCVAEWAHAHGLTYDYVYIESAPGKPVSSSVLLAYQLDHDPNYRLVYEEKGVAIFERK